jgi:uncharacterized protein DUF6894
MPQYTFYVWNKRSRIKYPRSYALPDVKAAREFALRIAQVFGEVVPGWDELSYEQQNDYAIEVDNEFGQTVLTIPFRDVEEPMT